MAQNQADIGQYQELLTNFAVELGMGGSTVVDQVATPTPFDNQSYAIPKYATPLQDAGKMQTAVRGDGELPVRTSGAPVFVPGKCGRRGLKSDIDLETLAQPHGDLFASESVEVQKNLFNLVLEREQGLKTLLDAQGAVSGYYLTLTGTPSAQFDYTTADPKIIKTLESVARAAELNSGKPVDDPNWRWIIPPLVGDAIKEYLRTKLLYTEGQFQIGGKLPTALAGITPILAGSMKDTAKAGQTPSVARVWSDDKVYLVYVDPTFASNARTFTAFAQPRWTGRPKRSGIVTASYAVWAWDDIKPDVLKRWVAVDIYDNLEVISPNGIYVINDVLST